MTARETHRGRTVVVVSLCIAVAAIAVAAYISYQPDSTEVLVARPLYQDIDATVSTNGRVVPVKDFRARATFAGVVDDVYVHVGQVVHPGQLLIKMEDPFASSRLASATAAVKAAELNDQNIHQGGTQEERMILLGDRAHAEMEQNAATRALAVLTQLKGKGAASQAEINAATQRLQAANATLQTVDGRNTDRYSSLDKETWAARLADARSSLAAQEITYRNANIVSPVAGTVYLAPVSQYDFVQMGADLLHVADLSKVKVVAYFDEADMGQLRAGQGVRITWDGAPNRVWHGHIDQPPLATMISGGRNIGQCSIAVDDAKGDLPPDTNVVVAVTVEHHRNALTLPREALETAGRADFVYRVVGDSLVKTGVDIGVVNLSRVEITRGITSKDVIALQAIGNTTLINHLRVRPTT